MTEYPLDKLADRSTGRFLLHATGYFLFYVGWEIYFRGFMQFGLQARFGVWQAILVQTLASCLLHIGKPTVRFLGRSLAESFGASSLIVVSPFGPAWGCTQRLEFCSTSSFARIVRTRMAWTECLGCIASKSPLSQEIPTIRAFGSGHFG